MLASIIMLVNMITSVVLFRAVVLYVLLHVGTILLVQIGRGQGIKPLQISIPAACAVILLASFGFLG